MTAISEIQRARCVCIQKKNVKRFYIKKSGHLGKSKTIIVTFLYTKSKTLYVTQFFMKMLKLVFIQKSLHFALRDVFLYKKLDNPQKARQCALRFYIQKYAHFASHNFSLNF